ncbi:putative dipeptidyl-peptidase 1 [Triangularia verruculosa]|uniref:Dipeptidyl-peptidase 1 n=1 Tax=Triangularia verruculosa TaxID=2587418 RepID=A0AAN6X7Z7_9PEZI|nr:putative dipeptidyl-peptidase 1 [Triangularia verruculosa]
MSLVELLLLSLVSVADASPLRRGVSWPVPIPASSVPPIEWDAIGPPIYKPVRDNAASNQYTANKKVSAANINTASFSLPPIVDWRNRSGVNFITTPQDQGACQSCWAFAVTALIETQVRIEHSVWSKRSEADVHDGIGAICETTGSAEETLRYVAGNTTSSVHSGSGKPGIADWSCDPYEAVTTPHAHCSDRSGRATHIGEFQEIGGIEEQKRWLLEYGPIVATFILYSDFGGWKPDPNPYHVYKWDGTSGNTGNHIALVVGYDDERGAWIMKNSWGKGWGDDGFVYFAYDNANIDMWTKYGLRNVNPDPWTRKRHQSGNMMNSGNGETHRNFELLLSDLDRGIMHLSRDGDTGKWSSVSQLATTDEKLSVRGQPSIIGTSRNRDFHAVALTEDNNIQQWTYSQSSKKWSQLSGFGQSKVDGFPGLVQSDDSSLVVVVKHTDGTLNEYRQEANSETWTLVQPPISSNITQSGASLVQSNVGLDIYDRSGSSRGKLYVVATRGDGKMQTFWREGDSTTWRAGEAFGAGIPNDAAPVMIQDIETVNETSAGGLQLAVSVHGSVEHWRWHPQMEEKWERVERVGERVKQVWSLVQGSTFGRLHMITESVDGVIAYWEWDGTWSLVEELPAVGDDSRWGKSAPVSGG